MSIVMLEITKKIYSISESDYGLILKNQNYTLALNESQRENQAPYYLKQLQPTKKYITGLFLDKRKAVYRGNYYGVKIIISIRNNEAYIN